MSMTITLLCLFVAGIGIGALCWRNASSQAKGAEAEARDTKVNFTKRFIGCLLVTIGVLMLTLCGGCTLIFLGYETYDEMFQISKGEDYVNIYSIGIIGGIPTFAAIVIFFVGRWLRKWGRI